MSQVRTSVRPTGSEFHAPRIRPSDTVGAVAGRFPSTLEVFEWYDIDPDYDGRATLDEMADELAVDVDHMVDQLVDVAAHDERLRAEESW